MTSATATATTTTTTIEKLNSKISYTRSVYQRLLIEAEKEKDLNKKKQLLLQQRTVLINCQMFATKVLGIKLFESYSL